VSSRTGAADIFFTDWVFPPEGAAEARTGVACALPAAAIWGRVAKETTAEAHATRALV